MNRWRRGWGRITRHRHHTILRTDTRYGVLEVLVEFKFQDMWVGLFWDTRYNGGHEIINHERAFRLTHELWVERVRWDVWLVLVPCFPLHVRWYVT